jgi:NitT/TauT family transport system permease protein
MQLILRVFFFVGLILLWEIVVVTTGIRSYLLPAPSAIATELVDSAPHLARHGLTTITEALLGFAISAVVGVATAILIVYSRFLRSVLLPLLVATNATPKVAFAPLLLIWLGLGIESKVAMAFLLSFFPIVINATTGLAEVEPEMLNLFRLLRASQFQMLVKVRIPHALPAIVDGFKIAMPLAIIGAIVGEFVGGQEGLGYLIVLAGVTLNTELVFASIVVVAFMSIVCFEALVLIERHVLKWRPSARRF